MCKHYKFKLIENRMKHCYMFPVLGAPTFGQVSGSPPAWPTFGKPSDKDKNVTGVTRSGPAPAPGPKPAPPERVDSLRPDIPPELQGVSVKDLVKALGILILLTLFKNFFVESQQRNIFSCLYSRIYAFVKIITLYMYIYNGRLMTHELFILLYCH